VYYYKYKESMRNSYRIARIFAKTNDVKTYPVGAGTSSTFSTSIEFIPLDDLSPDYTTAPNVIPREIAAILEKLFTAT